MTIRFVPPRVPLVDPRTGTITREWYLFFQTLMDPQAATGDEEQALLASVPALSTGDEVSAAIDAAAMYAPPGCEVQRADDLTPPTVAREPGVDELMFPPPQAPNIGSMGEQDANGVAITGGTISGLGSLGVTGASTFGLRTRVIAFDQTNARIGVQNTATGGRNYYLVAGIVNIGQDCFSIYDDTAAATRMIIRGNGVFNIANVPTYASDAAAGAAGLVQGDLYKSAAGVVSVKL